MSSSRIVFSDGLDVRCGDGVNVYFGNLSWDLPGCLRRFADRGIPFVVAQEHVPGDLVKFYGVRNGARATGANWFQWFYHRDRGMLGHPFAAARLHEAALDAAAALGLEIFGGDAIIKANGEPMIIDLNAWPSYALYRDQAAQAIADLLSERFRRRPRIVASTRN